LGGVILGFELRALQLPAIPPTLFALLMFLIGSHSFAHGQTQTTIRLLLPLVYLGLQTCVPMSFFLLVLVFELRATRLLGGVC
jgi:hypothetical protein